MGLSSAYSGPGGQNVREQQGGYSYNSPASASGGSSSSGISDLFQGLFTLLGNVSQSPFLGVLGNLFTNSRNRRSIEETNRLNYQMQQQQNAWNERMWHMYNEYNTPANQIKRLKEAGLNPNLLYGNPSQGTSSAPAQGTTPSHAEAFQSLGFGDMISNAQQLMMQKKANDAQIKLMNSQAEQMDVETQLKKKDLGTYDKRTAQMEELNKAIISNYEAQTNSILEKYPHEIDEIRARIGVLAEQENLTREQYFDQKWDNFITQKTFQEQIRRFKLENDLTDAQIREIEAAIKLMAKQAVLVGNQAGYFGNLSSLAFGERMERGSVPYLNSDGSLNTFGKIVTGTKYTLESLSGPLVGAFLTFFLKGKGKLPGSGYSGTRIGF